jgi:hypothetical protein
MPFKARLFATAGVRQSSIGGIATHDDEPGSYAERSTATPATPATGPKEQGETSANAEVTSEQEPGHNGTEESKPLTLRSSLVTNLLALFFLLYIFWWNLTTVSNFTMPERLVPLGHALGIGQKWDMFAPYPAKDDGWYVIPGDLEGGQQVDLMPITRDDYTLHGVSWEKPENVADTYKNEHWRKYLEKIRGPDDKGQFLHFGRYICREWNARHAGDEQLVNFQIIYMQEQTQPDYQSSVPQKVVLWNHRC